MNKLKWYFVLDSRRLGNTKINDFHQIKSVKYSLIFLVMGRVMNLPPNTNKFHEINDFTIEKSVTHFLNIYRNG